MVDHLRPGGRRRNPNRFCIQCGRRLSSATYVRQKSMGYCAMCERRRREHV